MSRLFWKFFTAILLAQGAATVGGGAVFWLWDQAREPNSRSALIDTRPSALAILDGAAVALKHGGPEALRELVSATNGSQVFAVDESGHDLLGRIISAELRAAMLTDGRSQDAVRHLSAPDGRRFTVFVRHPDHWGRAFRGGPRMFGGPGPGPGPGGPPKPGPWMPYIGVSVSILASLLFAAVLAWYILRPIRALQNAFHAAASGDLAPRFANMPRRRGDELVELGRDFDRMTAQLRALMDNQRRLLHDVSHELRSPLARLQAAVGLAHQQPEKSLVSLERIERESVRIDRLVGELLTLARLDSASGLPQPEQVPIMDLVEEIAADARFEAGQSERSVMVSGTTEALVSGSPDLLWRAIENIVRNAVKYSPAHGVVEIVVENTPDQVLVSVLDRGPGVTPTDLHTIFQAFYRSSPDANHIDGHGLGLAIARRVIDAYGGTIGALNRDGGGLCVTVALPRSRA